MSNTLQATLLLVVAAVALLALGLAALAFRDARARRRRPEASALPTDLAGLRDEVERLRAEAQGALRHVAVVRYDAFGDMGGRLSWSLALADDGGDGVVLTTISGRSESRTYAKGLAAWSSDQPLSPEEEAAVTRAKAG